MNEARICGAFATVPSSLFADMLAIGNGDFRDMVRHLRCRLEAHPPGFHFDLVWQLDDARQGEMWAIWSDGRDAEAVFIRPDCPGGTDACTLFAQHPGRCSFDFSDPVAEVLLAGLESEMRVPRGHRAPPTR
ncbi:hypothetical protein [Streptomyces sp. NPDC020965]|uniref:hypothetical protein n=1 Tax=Streptomyces sp. NPDC020965 TaxID=3365105 RepID=UPI0037AC3FEB